MYVYLYVYIRWPRDLIDAARKILEVDRGGNSHPQHSRTLCDHRAFQDVS
jgi:hypothetical protein